MKKTVEIADVGDGSAVDIMANCEGVCNWITLNAEDAQKLVNDLQNWIDSTCNGKSPLLHDAEHDALAAAIDQANQCRRAAKAAKFLSEYAEKLMSETKPDK